MCIIVGKTLSYENTFVLLVKYQIQSYYDQDDHIQA